MRPFLALSAVALVAAGCAADFATNKAVSGDRDGGDGGGGRAAGGAGGASAGGHSATGGINSAGAGGGSAGAGAGGGGVSSGGAPTDGGADATLPDAGPGPCIALAGNATDVYVDKRYASTISTGAAGCPFTTINAGIVAAASLTGTRTVHVAGATPALVYTEAAPVAVNTNVVLLGDGPAKTTISASGTCGSGTCAVMVNGAGILDGFTVVSPGGDGIVASLTAPAPVLRNVATIGSKGNGILSLGSIDVGPNVVASKNGGQGLASTGAGIVHVIGSSSSNAFDGNVANGIDVEGATLIFDGGSASGNGFNGIRLGAAGPLATTGTVTGLVAKNNKNTGVSSFGGQNLKLRSSTLLTNGNYGLLYSYVAGYALDLGTAIDPGGNTFGATRAAQNPKAGIYLCMSRGPATQPAAADTFAACPPTQTSLAGCDVAPASYTDVAYAPAVAGAPVAATSCIVGP
jgi:hypothetical protein